MRWLLSPRWLVAHVTVIVVAIVFVNLGFWQLRRLEERRVSNTVGESRFQAEPVDIAGLVAAAGADEDTLEFRRATATGVFQPDDEVLIRSQVFQGTAGFHVITPLLAEDGSATLVNRGWVPMGLDEVPVAEAPPPEGTVTVEGWLRPTRERTGLGPADPEAGRLVVMSRVDIQRIAEQVPYELQPVYLVLLDGGAGQLPVPVESPTFEDEGSHLAYAIQWFSFALIGLVGYFFLIRRGARRPR